MSSERSSHTPTQTEPEGRTDRNTAPGRATLVQRLARPSVGPAERAHTAPSEAVPAGAPGDFSAAMGFVGGPAASVDASIGRLAAAREKAVDGAAGSGAGLIKEHDPPGNGEATPANGSPPKKKKAGVESFTVEWAKGINSSATDPSLRLDYKAKFKKDDDHDPSLAEFRQSVMTKFEITDGPNKGQKADTSPMHDDNYSRADDTAGNKKTDQLFQSNDNPGIGPIHKDDVLDYSFTAEQTIIDTSDGNKVLEKRGPHTGTIKGKDPRVHGNVPVKLG